MRPPPKSPGGRRGVLPFKLRREVVRSTVPNLHAGSNMRIHAREDKSGSVRERELVAPRAGCPQWPLAQRRGRQAGKKRAIMRPPGTRLGTMSSRPPQFTRTGWHASVAAHRQRAEALCSCGARA